MKIIVDAENRTQRVFNQLSDNLDAIKKANHGVVDAMKTVGTAGAVAFGGLAFGVKEVVSTAADMQSLMAGLTAVAGSADKANAEFKELREVAKLPGLGLREAVQGATNLQAAGMSAELAKRSLMAFGNALATVGKGKADLDGVNLALTQLAQKQSGYGQDLRQLQERLPQVRQALVAAFGTGDTEELAKSGKTGQQVIDALIKEFEKLPPVSATTKTAFENLQDNMYILSDTIGKTLLPSVNRILDAITPVIEKLTVWTAAHPSLTAGIIAVSLVIAGLLAVLLPLAIALPGIILLFGGLASAFAFIVSGPGLLIVGSIAAIVAALTYLWKEGYLTKEAWLEVWTGIKLIAADSANAVIGTVESMVNFIISGVNMAINAINKVIGLAQKVPGIGKNISKIGTLDAVSFGRYDTEAIAASSLNKTTAAGSTVINVTGNTLLDADAATKMGDLILGRLKLSNAL